MTKPIKITVTGTDNRGDDAPMVQDLLSQIQDQVDILQAVEGAIFDDGKEKIIWRVTDVTKNSPITFEITPYPKTHEMDVQSRINNVIVATANGLQMLLIQGDRPPHFTDAVLKKIENISKRVTNGLAGSKVDFSEYEDAPQCELTHDVAAKTVKKIAEIRAPAHHLHREIGSVEGYIKTVGRDGLGRPVLTLATRIDGTDVKCVSSDGGLDKISHLEVGAVTQGLRVRAHGLLHFKSPGVLDRIEVERVECFEKEDDLPTIQDLIDPEFTGGLEAVEYMRLKRDDG